MNQSGLGTWARSLVRIRASASEAEEKLSETVGSNPIGPASTFLNADSPALGQASSVAFRVPRPSQAYLDPMGRQPLVSPLCCGDRPRMTTTLAHDDAAAEGAVAPEQSSKWSSARVAVFLGMILAFPLLVVVAYFATRSVLPGLSMLEAAVPQGNSTITGGPVLQRHEPPASDGPALSVAELPVTCYPAAGQPARRRLSSGSSCSQPQRYSRLSLWRGLDSRRGRTAPFEDPGNLLEGNRGKLAAILDEAVAKLNAGSSYRETVIQCYKMISELLEERSSGGRESPHAQGSSGRGCPRSLWWSLPPRPGDRTLRGRQIQRPGDNYGTVPTSSGLPLKPRARPSSNPRSRRVVLNDWAAQIRALRMEQDGTGGPARSQAIRDGGPREPLWPLRSVRGTSAAHRRSRVASSDGAFGLRDNLRGG